MDVEGEDTAPLVSVEQASALNALAFAPETAAQVIVAAGARLKRTAAQMEPHIKVVVEDNWHDTPDSLVELTDEDWSKMKVPGALVKEVRALLAGSAAPKQPIQAKSFAKPLVNEGDLLQGTLWSASKHSPSVPIAIYIKDIKADEFAPACTITARICCIANNTESLIYEATGTYKLGVNELDLQATELIQACATCKPVRLIGRFDLRCSSPTFYGDKPKFMEATASGFVCKPSSTFATFEVELKSSVRTRAVSLPTDEEQRRIDVLQEIGTDSAEVRSLAQELIASMQTFRNGSLPIVGKWLQRLDELLDCKQTQPPKVMLTGPMGSGKSYLDNAILGHLGLLPADCSTGRAVSAANVAAKYRPFRARPSDGPGEWLLHSLQTASSDPESPPISERKRFGAEIELLNPEEWQKERAGFVNALSRYWLEDEIEKNIKKKRPQDTESGAGAAHAWDKLEAVYSSDALLRGKKKSWESEEELCQHLDELEKTNPVIRRLGKLQTIENNDARAFSEELKKYVRTEKAGSGVNFWPVVTNVLILGPFERLRGLGHIMDSVGRGDSNSARDCLAQLQEREADVVWIIVDISRCVNNSIAIEMLKNQLRSVLLRCSQSDFAFICTKADVINQREAINTLKLDPNATLRDCILARNRLVKQNMQGEIRRMIVDMQRGDEDNDFAWLSCKVFCVSTKAYMVRLGAETGTLQAGDLEVADTELPLLIQELQMQALRYGNKGATSIINRLAEISAAVASQLSKGQSLEEHRALCRSEFGSLQSAFKNELARKLATFQDEVCELFEKGLLASIKDGSRLAGSSAPHVAKEWHNYNPASYIAAARKNGVNPNSKRGAIDWPRELSRKCYDAFQPQWMELFGSQLPGLYAKFETIVKEETSRFHDELVQRLPMASEALEELRHGIRLDSYLHRKKDDLDNTERLAKRELCDEVVDSVNVEMKGAWTSARGIKGKGTFVTVKDYVDRQVSSIKWQEVTEGLFSGAEELLAVFESLKDNVVAEVPKMLQEGYEVLWQDLDENALAEWHRLREAALPTAAKVKTEADALITRLANRESSFADVSMVAEAADEQEGFPELQPQKRKHLLTEVQRKRLCRHVRQQRQDPAIQVTAQVSEDGYEIALSEGCTPVRHSAAQQEVDDTPSPVLPFAQRGVEASAVQDSKQLSLWDKAKQLFV